MSGTNARGPGRGEAGRGVSDVGCSYKPRWHGSCGAEDVKAEREKEVGVLMSYVCDAETPKLAHAIVYVYVYPL